MRVRMNLRQSAWVLAVMLGTGVTVGTARAAAPQSSEDHAQDYSRNKNYQVVIRDGRNDKAHNRDHFKKRNFKKDEDQRAYESGYQQGHLDDQK
jgi:hypothetical protein